MTKDKKTVSNRIKLGFGIVLMVIMTILVCTSISVYPRKIKKMFVQSSVAAMESKIAEEADFTNENVEINYEEIRLLAGLMTKYLDGTSDYNENVLAIMAETKEKAGFEQIGILKMDDERSFATTSEGRLVQLDIWVLDVDNALNEVTIELQTSPFKTVDEGCDAVVYRYVFKDNTGTAYMLIAEKSQETLNSILNVNADQEGLTLVMRDNGNVIYGRGKVGVEEITSYNFWAYLDKLGASEEIIADAKKSLQDNQAGKFKLDIEGEPYHFVFQNIENTKWICVNAYSETYLAGSDLEVVNHETMKLVMIVTLTLILALILSVVSASLSVRKQGEIKILEREKLFEEMSRYIPSAFAIIPEKEQVPSFISHNFNDVVQGTIDECTVSKVQEWIGDELVELKREEFKETGRFREVIEKADRSFSVGIYDIGIIQNKRHYVLIFDDVTDEMNSRKLLEDSMERAANASKSKTSFLSKMSHEIRTPLNSIIGFSKLTIDGWNHTDQNELLDYVNKIQSAGTYLLELVSDILDISRIEEGRMKVIYTQMSLDRMVDDVTNAFAGQMQRKNIQFVVDKYYDDVTLNIDQIHTKQILNNLISNSCKYTEEGGCVGFEVTAKPLSAKQMAVQFVIQDTGIGMSEEFVAKIFEPFTQDERGMLMKNQLRGSGLGMSICKNLVELLNGSIKVESELGEGSVFTVQLIFDIVENAEEKHAASTKKQDYSCLKNKKILVVDDIEANVFVIEKLLENYGLVFESATNGQEAVAKYEASAPGEYFAIFMDVHMPIMDGYQATEIIRKMSRADASKVAIVAMTADAFSDDVNKALMSGMNYHVTKPVEVEHVLDVLMEINHKGD